MSDPYLGEIRWFPYMRGAPSGWLACDGSVLNVSEYQALASLLGTTYGGDGSSTFGIPDLRGRVPVHQGAGNGLTPRSIGQTGGSETIALNTQQLPQHSHVFQATTAAAEAPAAKQFLPAALPSGTTFYSEDVKGANPLDPMPQMFGSTGNNVGHDNCAPSLPILACIAWNGQYPARST